MQFFVKELLVILLYTLILLPTKGLQLLILDKFMKMFYFDTTMESLFDRRVCIKLSINKVVFRNNNIA